MRERIRANVDAVLSRDPACRSRWEAWLCYPGLHALLLHQVAHRLHHGGFPLLARLLSQFSRWITGVEIHPGAEIGRGVFIDHGMGVVIGETAVVGDNVTMYQGVTLGGTGKERGKRHPTVGNDVVIGVGAKILGNIVIGDHSKVGAGAVVLRSVPPHCTVVGVPGRVVRREGRRTDEAGDLEHGDLPDPVALDLARMVQRYEALEARIVELESNVPQRERKTD